MEKGLFGEKKTNKKSHPERGENEEKTMGVFLSFHKGEPRGKQDQEHWVRRALNIVRQNESLVCNNQEL